MSVPPPGVPREGGFDVWIEAGGVQPEYWRSLWRYRELLLILAWRDVAVRYRQTVAGVAWALLQPLTTVATMTFVFSKIAGLPSQGSAPYPVMVLAALLPWQFFANGLSAASHSVLNNASLVSKIYFPRLILPVSAIVVALADFVVAAVILAGLMAWYQVWPTWRLLALPALVLLAMATALGPGLIMTALTVRYRDVRFVIPFVVQVGLYASPIAYSSAIVRERLGDAGFLAYSLNPMVGVVDGFRWAILGGPSNIFWPGLLLSVALAVGLCFGGLRYFRRTERVFADII